MYTFSLVEFLFESRIQINIKWMPFVFRLNICIIYSRRFTSSHVAVLQCNEMHWFTYQLNLGTILVLLLLFFFFHFKQSWDKFSLHIFIEKTGEKMKCSQKQKKNKTGRSNENKPKQFYLLNIEKKRVGFYLFVVSSIVTLFICCFFLSYFIGIHSLTIGHVSVFNIRFGKRSIPKQFLLILLIIISVSHLAWSLLLNSILMKSNLYISIF